MKFFDIKEDSLIVPLTALLREQDSQTHPCKLLVSNLGSVSEDLVLGTAIFQQFAMSFMPLSDTEKSVRPYVTIYAQKGALPGTVAGDNFHHKKVTNLLMLAFIITIVLVIVF